MEEYDFLNMDLEEAIECITKDPRYKKLFEELGYWLACRIAETIAELDNMINKLTLIVGENNRLIHKSRKK